MTNQSRPITIKDIAAKVGVSKSAVSLALNNKPGISEQLRQKIFATAADLGYHQPVSRLKKQQQSSKSITAVFQYGPSSDVADYTALHSMSLEWLKAIRLFVEKKNSHLTFIEGYRGGEISYLGQQLIDDKNHQVDGLILMGPGVHQGSKMVRKALEQNIPLAIVCRSWSDLPVNTVGQSYREQARVALNHLVALGHRQIAFAARTIDQGYEWFEARLAEYKRIMQTEIGCNPDGLIFVADDETQVVKNIMAAHPAVTAIFGLHDTFCFRLLDALENQGIVVPDDMSIIGQDDTIPNQQPRIGLTTVGYNHSEVGYLAAETIFTQLQNPEIVCSKITVRSSLVERQSCRPL